MKVLSYSARNCRWIILPVVELSYENTGEDHVLSLELRWLNRWMVIELWIPA
jgi:hypothetical protein